MSSVDQVLNTGSQSTTNYDVAKIFVWDNRYDKGTIDNDTYDAVNYLAGRVLGRIAATGKIVPLDSGASDGSQYPVGILAQDVTIEEGESEEVMFCVAGDVVENKLSFTDTDDLDTVIDGRQLRDRIAADTVGVKLIASTEQTGFDNQ